MRANRHTMRMYMFTAAILLACCLSRFHAGAQDDSSEKYISAMEKIGTIAQAPQEELLRSIGVTGGSGLSTSRILCYVVFGAIGFVAFMYGKSMKNPKPFVLGIALSSYPYFVQDLYWMWAIGIMLCLLLYLTRD